jgi:hypothetical protein
LYAIGMSDYDQEDDTADSRKTLLTTRDGVKTVALHFKSIGRLVFFPCILIKDHILFM